VQRLGGYLEESDADRILGDVEDFARRQPWAVVAGGLALGFMAARFMKASSSERYQQRLGSSSGSSAGSASNGTGAGYGRTATPTEGVDAGGRRFTNPGTDGAPAPSPATGATPGVTPATGVLPQGT
jgi:hypothetical protein